MTPAPQAMPGPAMPGPMMQPPAAGGGFAALKQKLAHTNTGVSPGLGGPLSGGML